MLYAYPCDARTVTDNYQDHLDRGSAEPGTDYAAAYGSPLYASADGIVADLSHSPSGGTGRYVTVDLHDGRRTRSLHLAEVWVGIGAAVTRGQVLGLTGASGHGSDWGYGAHVHQTLFPRHAYDFTETLNFENYVGEDPAPEPPPWRDDEMIRIQHVDRGLGLIGPGWYTPLHTNAEVNASAAMITKHMEASSAEEWDLWVTIAQNGRSADPITPYPTPPGPPDPAPVDPCAQAEATKALLTPAWLGGAFLGLIGLVEVVRFILEHLA